MVAAQVRALSVPITSRMTHLSWLVPHPEGTDRQGRLTEANQGDQGDPGPTSANQGQPGGVVEQRVVPLLSGPVSALGAISYNPIVKVHIGPLAISPPGVGIALGFLAG